MQKTRRTLHPAGVKGQRYFATTVALNRTQLKFVNTRARRMGISRSMLFQSWVEREMEEELNKTLTPLPTIFVETEKK